MKFLLSKQNNPRWDATEFSSDMAQLKPFTIYILWSRASLFYKIILNFLSVSVLFVFVKGSSRGWNVFLWLGLFMGMGLLMCLYSMEFFARRNCPGNYVSHEKH